MDIAESHSAKPAGFTGGLCRLNSALANRYSGSTVSIRSRQCRKNANPASS